MAGEIISKKTLHEFAEAFSGWYVIRTIQVAFDSEDIDLVENHQPNTSGERRRMVAKYCASLDLTKWSDAQKLLRVFEGVLDTIQSRIESMRQNAQGDEFFRGSLQNAERDTNLLLKALKRDGFVFKNGRIVPETGVLASEDLKQAADALDAAHVQQHIARIERAVYDDPWLAIGQSKELVECVCKTVLVECGREADPDWAITKLAKEALAELDLAPAGIPDSAKGAVAARRVLGNLSAMVDGLMELRKHFGTGHGHEGRKRGLESRHAGLSAGAAITFSTFMFQTLEDRRHSKGKP